MAHEQDFAQRLRKAMSEVEMTYFNRVFTNNEPASTVKSEMGLDESFEDNMLRNLRGAGRVAI